MSAADEAVETIHRGMTAFTRRARASAGRLHPEQVSALEGARLVEGRPDPRDSASGYCVRRRPGRRSSPR